LGLRQNFLPVVDELRQQARAAGYDPAQAIERLDYGTYVSSARCYMYVETPKAACTSFKHLIAGIEGIAPDTTARPYQRETRIDMLIHQRRHIALPTLLSADAQSRAAILRRAPGWMIFALVRNPFSRLVSFFENKVRLGEPGYRRLEACYGDVSRFGGLQAAFAAFVAEVVTDRVRSSADFHLLPQGEILMPRLIPYTHIFRMERADEAVQALAGHLAGLDGGGPPVPAIRNRSRARDWRSYYHAASAEIVAKVYAEDFALFGYDSADWRKQDGAGGNGVPPDEDYWRAELVARNALIERLYDHLGVPPR
jgi:hypothetical protein